MLNNNFFVIYIYNSISSLSQVKFVFGEWSVRIFCLMSNMTQFQKYIQRLKYLHLISEIKKYFNTDMTLGIYYFFFTVCFPGPALVLPIARRVNVTPPMYVHTHSSHKQCGTVQAHTHCFFFFFFRLVCKVESSTYGTIINLDSSSVAVPPPASH